MPDKSDSNEVYNPQKQSKSFSVEMILDDFSFWFPRARGYGYTADELYETDENAVAVAIPIPILKDGNYKLWFFCFCRVERITPRGVKILIAELSRMSIKLGYLIHFRYYFVIADRITRRIPPRCSRAKSVYIIRAEYAYKVYEIVAKAIGGFVKSFRKNVKYGDDLLCLCDDLERFAERMRKRAEELKSKSTSTTHPSPTHHLPDTDRNNARDKATTKEAEEHLTLLEKSKVMK